MTAEQGPPREPVQTRESGQTREPGQARDSDQARRLGIEGELTIFTAAEHHQRLRSLLEGGSDLRLDLSGVTGLDTAGIQVLLLARREASRRGLDLTFHEPSQAVTEVLSIAHLDGEFDQARAGAGLET